MDISKPHRGRIVNWTASKIAGPFGSRLAVIVGQTPDHPDAPVGHTFPIITSAVILHDDRSGEIETVNSRYTLVGPDVFSKQGRA